MIGFIRNFKSPLKKLLFICGFTLFNFQICYSYAESLKNFDADKNNDFIKHIDKVTKNLIDQGFACWDDASKKNKLIVTGTSKLLDDVKAMEQLEDVRVLIEKLEKEWLTDKGWL